MKERLEAEAHVFSFLPIRLLVRYSARRLTQLRGQHFASLSLDPNLNVGPLSVTTLSLSLSLSRFPEAVAIGRSNIRVASLTHFKHYNLTTILITINLQQKSVLLQRIFKKWRQPAESTAGATRHSGEEFFSLPTFSESTLTRSVAVVPRQPEVNPAG